MSGSDLNLHHLAQTVLQDSVSPDPGVMADELVARIPATHYREALEVLAKDYMRNRILNQRHRVNGGAPNVGSRKVGAARDAWKRLLDTPEFLPGVGWLFLRDATVDQVLAMAGVRRAKATELEVVAERYAALAKEMKRTRTGRVGDLSEESLRQLLGEEQAA